jgi:hypothetical protein
MLSEERLPLLEEILEEWKAIIGADYAGYKNHVYRMVHFCMALQNCSQEEQEKIIIAGCFHDLGIWIEDTFDYIMPSLPAAQEYLKRRALEHWSTEIELMISEHHKLRAYKDRTYPLVELFRKGDLVDFSLGLVTFGLSRAYIAKIKARYPNAGFHRNLVKLAARWFVRHPLNPIPVVKW